MRAQPAGRVVVGVTDSMAGLQALRVAGEEARRRGVTLRAVRAWRLSANWAGSQMRRWAREILAEETVELREAFAMAMGGVPADVPVELVVVEGAPGPALVGQATGEDDLIVVGTPARGRGWSAAGVAQYCRHYAGCPVLAGPSPRGRSSSRARVAGGASGATPRTTWRRLAKPRPVQTRRSPN